MDFSRVAVSSPVIDVSDFLYSSVHPGLISEHYVTLLQVNFAFHITRGEFRPLVIIPPFHLKAAHASCSLLGISRFWAPRLELLSQRDPGTSPKDPATDLSPANISQSQIWENMWLQAYHLYISWLAYHISWQAYHKISWQAYHTAHLEAIKGFGMHGYEIDFEVLVQEYQVRSSGHQIIRSDPFTSTSSPWYDVDDDLLCTCTLPRLPEIYLKLVFSISIYGL